MVSGTQQGGSGQSEPIHGAVHRSATAIQYVRVDRRLDAFVAEELLNGADVVAHFQKMGCKAMAQRVRAERPMDPSGTGHRPR